MGGLFDKETTQKPEYEISPELEHTKTLIWLHGIKSSAEEFLDVFSDPDTTPVDKHTKVILLNSGKKKISAAFGMRVNAWFNIYSRDYTKLDKFLDYEQLEEWRIRITERIHKEVQTHLGGDYSKLMIGGFSQGAAVALYIASTLKHSDDEVINWQKSWQMELCNQGEIKSAIDSNVIIDQEQSSKQNLEAEKTNEVENRDIVDNLEAVKLKDTNVGCVIYCSGLHLFQNPENDIYKLNKFPIFVYHGVDDDMINWDYSIRPFLRLSDKHPEIEVNTEDMGHGFCDNEWEKMKKFIEKVTTPSTDQ